MAVININGLKVTYSDAGHGAPVIFVPGVVGKGDWFGYQTSGLADRFRVITYDLRRARGTCSLDMLVDDLARLIQALKAYDAAVVGYSLGGLIALKYAAVYPDRCPGLVLCSTAPSYSRIPDSEMAAQLLPDGICLPNLWQRIREAISGRRAERAASEDPDSFLARSAGEVNRASLNARIKLMRKTDLTALLDKVEVPTLIVASSEEPSHVLSGAPGYAPGDTRSLGRDHRERRPVLLPHPARSVQRHHGGLSY